MERRNLGNDDGLDLPAVDPVLVKQAEAKVHTWLNHQRERYCRKFTTYQKSGHVNFATQNLIGGKQQYLLEVKYGTEIFLARVSMEIIGSKINAQNEFKVLDLVPGPCETGFKNQLAVTTEGALLLECTIPV